MGGNSTIRCHLERCCFGFHCSAVAFIFLLAWVLMIAVTVLFIVGGFTYTEACRPVVQLQPNSSFYKVNNVYFLIYVSKIKLRYLPSDVCVELSIILCSDDSAVSHFKLFSASPSNYYVDW